MSVVGPVTFLGCGHHGYLFGLTCTAGFSHTHHRCNAHSHKVRFTRPSAPGEWTHRNSVYLDKLDGLIRGYTAQYIQVIKDAEEMGWTKQDVHGSLTDVNIDMSNAIKAWKSECGRNGHLVSAAGYLEDRAALLALFPRKKLIDEGPAPYAECSQPEKIGVGKTI